MKIGKNMRRIRQKHGWTQKEVADRLNANPTTYCKWEKDTALPDMYMIMDIAKLFDVSLDELCSFTRPGEKEYNQHEKAMFRLKGMGIKFTEEADTLKIDMYGVKYNVNVSDLPMLIDKTDAQYDAMLTDANKSLFKAAMAVILNSGKFTFQLVLSDDEISKRVYFWCEEHKEPITLYVLIDIFREELLVLSSVERKKAWDYIVDVLLRWNIIEQEDVDTGKWDCPIIDFKE